MRKIDVICLLDMMGGKPSSHYNDGKVSHTLTCGRASTNDIHVVCYRIRKGQKKCRNTDTRK